MQSHPKIDGVLAANDAMALGAIEAFDGANRKVLVVGINGTKEAIDAIKAGRLLASGDYNGFVQGCLGTMAAIRRLRNLPVPKEVVFPAIVIDSTNYKAYDLLGLAAQLPEVGDGGQVVVARGSWLVARGSWSLWLVGGGWCMRSRIIAWLGVLVVTGVPLLAHHSAVAEYDLEKPVKVSGTVTKVEWSNPHIWFYVDVKNPDGTRDQLGILRRRAGRAAAARHQPHGDEAGRHRQGRRISRQGRIDQRFRQYGDVRGRPARVHGDGRVSTALASLRAERRTQNVKRRTQHVEPRTFGPVDLVDPCGPVDPWTFWT